jgi:hypothetical protein
LGRLRSVVTGSFRPEAAARQGGRSPRSSFANVSTTLVAIQILASMHCTVVPVITESKGTVAVSACTHFLHATASGSRDHSL